MAKPKLTYFDFAGSRGEECRLALAIAGVEFDDERIPSADWPALKPRTPWGNLPFFEIEGRPPLGQCNAILTYIGRTYDLLPSDPWEAAIHESLLAAGEELRGVVIPILRIKDKDASIAARQELATGYLPAWGRFVEAKLGEGPFVAGDRVSVADVKLHIVSKWFTSGVLDHVPTDVLDHCPKLLAVQQAVREHPRVVAWYADDS